MIGQTISHYQILEKLGEVPKSLPTLYVGIVTLSLPASCESQRQAGIPPFPSLSKDGGSSNRRIL